ncbi:hypothetical protein NDI54_05900 [Haloarcula sp. S1AR25-5A]|uniref:Uncharacterized protein n=1 Tax=Haloarcula terrestris TaxID=2950533 RepID=A0AAE4EVN2_9EURY|nr:hypothetical protein [Haloarcula terrestris]MDS0220887.1 hypothetical protein [Haloarcula terrestris]
MTLDEFIDELADELGLIHEDDLEGELTGTAAGDATPEDDERLEAYGTGVDEDREEALGAGFASMSPQAEQLHAEAAQKRREGDDVEEYGTGVQHGTDATHFEPTGTAADGEETVAELAARAADESGDSVDADDVREELEAYGTGEQGDTSREEHLQREERIEVLAEAFERAMERRGGSE